jgi:F-type H+-transporting ATPase subunit epsilon
MPDELQLRVVTPRRAVVDQTVLEVTAPGTVGEFGVLPDHASFLSSLESGRLSYRDGRGVSSYAVREGFAEVSDNVMIVLTDAAEPAAEIDAARARADLMSAEAELKTLSPIDPAYADAESRRRWAQARLEVAGAKQ